MPEHVHLLLSEPEDAVLGTALQALKLSVAVQSEQRAFWQARYYDFNVFTNEKWFEKLNYIHDKPCAAGSGEGGYGVSLVECSSLCDGGGGGGGD